MPDYAKEIPDNWRRYVLDVEDSVFRKDSAEEYDAYKDDVAIARFFFDRSTTFQFNRQHREAQ